MKSPLRRAMIAVPILLVAAAALLGAGCKGEPDTYTEQLVAPPGVPAQTPRGGAHVIVNLQAMEHETEIAPGVKYTTWSFNGSTPGPMVRARVGDTVEIHLANAADSKNSHNIDLHAVNGPGGGAGATLVKPGESKYFTFKAKTEGLFVYHCAAGIVADHITNGMYGAIMIDPPNGMDHVDKEFYVGQSEFYTNLDTNEPGNATLDMDKLFKEQPTYVTFNGNSKGLVGDKSLQAKVGDKVRIYFADGGPNLISSFHVIGEIFDRVWNYGATGSAPLTGVQTVLVPPGGAAVVEFKLDVPGDYKLVDHAIERVSKGAVGTLHVVGPADPSTFNAPGVSAAAANSHEMTTPAPATATTAAAKPSPSATSAASGQAPAGPNAVVLKDNVFEPKELTAKAGQAVTFTLKNAGLVPHNMHVAPLDGNFDSPQSVVSTPEIVMNGKTGTLTWTPPAAGTYKFRCDIHPDVMTGTIAVN